MTNADLLPAAVLKRKAVVYVRQSTQAQVQTNLESQRRQYELVDEARRRGFQNVEVIDDDLGRSASGMTARPGFDRLVAWLCAGEVGAVLCFDASRLARNGRDWHHLLELCGLVEARVIDLDGVYDPCRPNDRLLLGMKGSISEFELGVLRARMLDAARAKARRGELRIPVPASSLPFVTQLEPALEYDRIALSPCPLARRHSPFFLARFNTRRASALSSVGKWPRARTALRNLAFMLDCVCRIDDPTHFVGKGVERDDLAPMASPGLGDCRVFRPHGPSAKAFSSSSPAAASLAR